MKKVILLFLVSFLMGASSTAQSFSGKAVDSKGEPLEFTSVVLLSRKDSTCLSGTVTDARGKFHLRCETDSAFVRFSLLGYQTREMDLSSFKGTVVLEEKENMLQSVTIKAARPAYEMGKEGIVTKVAGTILSSMGTADDVLRYVPGVYKDNEQFTVFGKGAPSIYINGHLVRDMMELQNVKARDIKSVEVIQTPGAQYDATVKAVVKIRTIPPKGEGLGAGFRSVFAQSKNTDLTEQVDLSYNKGGMYLFGTYRYDKEAVSQQSEAHQNVYAESKWYQCNLISSDVRRETHEIMAGLNYDISSKHSLGAKYAMTFLPYRSVRTLTSTEVTLNNLSYDNLVTNAITLSDYRPKHNINLFYLGDLKGFSLEIDMDYLFSKYNSVQTSAESSEQMESREVVFNNVVQNKLFATKMVIGHKLFGGMFKVGFDTWTNSRDDDYYIDETGLLENTMSHLKESQVALLVEFRKRFTFGNITLGARYEHVNLKYNRVASDSKEQDETFTGFYPSLAWTQRIGKTMLSVSYAVKTKRPSYSQLSNNVQYVNRFTLQTGDPDLRSEHIHNITLAGAWKKLQFSVSYQDNRNAIVYWSEQSGDDNSVSIVRYKNIHSIKGVQGIVAYAPVFGFWHPQFVAGVAKQWLKFDTSLGTSTFDKPMFMCNLNNNLVWRSWILNADLNFRSKGDTQNQHVVKNTGELNIGISKSFLRGNLVIKMEGDDILNMRKNGLTMVADMMDLTQYNKFDTRQFKLTLRYNFNATKKQYKGSDINKAEKKRL